MNLYSVLAEWHMELRDKTTGKVYAHRVKIHVLDDDLSFYINGMVVYPPNDEHPNWSVNTPKMGKAHIVEFNGQKSKLWPEIKEACINAVQEHLRREKLDATPETTLYEKSDEEFKKTMMEDLEKLGF